MQKTVTPYEDLRNQEMFETQTKLKVKGNEGIYLAWLNFQANNQILIILQDIQRKAK